MQITKKCNLKTEKSFDMEKGNIFEDALTKWGENAQYDQTIEEMAELTVALNKLKRLKAGEKRDEKKTYDNLFTEIADVKVCIEELEFMLGKENVQQAYARQLEKFKKELYDE